MPRDQPLRRMGSFCCESITRDVLVCFERSLLSNDYHAIPSARQLVEQRVLRSWLDGWQTIELISRKLHIKGPESSRIVSSAGEA